MAPQEIARKKALKILRKYENRPTGYYEDEIVNAMIEYSDRNIESYRQGLKNKIEANLKSIKESENGIDADKWDRRAYIIISHML